ncbi:23S rRNA (uracil(1939)-C(5))-methyltransferase RlmD [Ruminococcaceae bacterium OttesenSCG-928-L11]|nr:23S rRNA (uracil(1939)-C(5))-methyltransferase RlmD [Ruminococcaceae bacterium OttesenSCG-928-L11]
MRKNEIVPLSITDIAQDGNGVGRYEGMVVFVPMTAPGDEIEARIVKVLKHHAYGIVARITSASPHRETPSCPVYKRCGGCSLQHLSYPAELSLKSNWVRENLARIGHLQPQLEAPIPSPQSQQYRNKAQYPIRRQNGHITAGFFAKRSHDLVPVADCILQPAVFADIVGTVCAFLEETGLDPYDEADGTGLVRCLYLRRADATGQIMVCLVINGGGIPGEQDLVSRLTAAFPAIATIVLNINRQRGNAILGDSERILYGDGKIRDILSGVSVELSAKSFYQVNHDGAQLLYQKALEYAAPQADDLLLDLYCGAGTIGLSMAAQAGRVLGVEIVEEAVTDARANAARNGIANAEFLCADASGAVLELQGRGISPAVVVLDPPRKGTTPEAIRSIVEMHPKRVVYVSCNSATLARDCALFREYGYMLTKAVTVDMFPRTAHVECVVLMTKVEE